MTDNNGDDPTIGKISDARETFELVANVEAPKLQKDQSNPVQGEIFSDIMPSISNEMLEMPNIFALSNLFPIPMRRKNSKDGTKHLKEQELYALKGMGRLRYTGPQLTRDHEDVFLALVKKVQMNQQSIMSPVYVSIYELLESAGLSTGTKNYELMRQVLRDLDQVSLEIFDEKILSRLVRLWENKEETGPEMQRFLEGHGELIKIMSEKFKAGNRFLTVKFIRNILGEMGTGDRFAVHLDPYTVLMYGSQSTIRVPSQARKIYKEKLTYKLVSMIRSQNHWFLDWREETWQNLILPDGEQMNLDRENRNRRATFRKNFESALKEAESWGEILPGWAMEEFYVKPEGMRGRGQKTFKTRFIRRLHPEMRTLLIKDKAHNGYPDHVFFAYLQSCIYVLNTQEQISANATIKISFEFLKTLFLKAPFPAENQPEGEKKASRENAEMWDRFLRLTMARYKSKGFLPESTEVITETMDGVAKTLLVVNLDHHIVFKKLRKKSLSSDQTIFEESEPESSY